MEIIDDYLTLLEIIDDYLTLVENVTAGRLNVVLSQSTTPKTQ